MFIHIDHCGQFISSGPVKVFVHFYLKNKKLGFAIPLHRDHLIKQPALQFYTNLHELTPLFFYPKCPISQQNLIYGLF